MGPSDLYPLTVCHIVISAPLNTRYVRLLELDVLSYKAPRLAAKYRLGWLWEP